MRNDLPFLALFAMAMLPEGRHIFGGILEMKRNYRFFYPIALGLNMNPGGLLVQIHGPLARTRQFCCVVFHGASRHRRGCLNMWNSISCHVFLITAYHDLSSLSWFITIYHHFPRYFTTGILSSFSLAYYMAYYMGVASQKQTEGSSDAMRKTLRPILAMCTSTSRALEENHTLPLPLELSNLS